MKKATNRIVGIILIIAAIAGLLFNIAGVVFVWREKDDLSASLVSTADTLDITLETTLQALLVAEASIKTSMDSVSALEDTISSTAKTIEASSPMVDTLADLMETNLPETVSSAQTSLASAQESARLIDSFLRALNRIPFISDTLYNPPVPLHIALRDVSDTLGELPEDFITMSESLTAASGNLKTVRTDIGSIARNVHNINTSLESAQTITGEYRTTVAGLQDQIQRTAARLPAFVNTAAWLLTFMFVWLGITQVGLLYQGLEMLGYNLLEDEDEEEDD